MSNATTAKAIDYLEPDALKYFLQPKLDVLDFTGFPEKYGYAKLDEIIPKNGKYGKHDPPPHYLISGKKVREWRSISAGNQTHILDNPPALVVTRDTSRRAERRAGRRRRHDSIEQLQPDPQLEQITNNNNDVVPSPLAKRQKVQEPSENDSPSQPHSNPSLESGGE